MRSAIAILTFERRAALSETLSGLRSFCGAHPIAIFDDASTRDDTRDFLARSREPIVSRPDLLAAQVDGGHLGENVDVFLGAERLGVAGNSNRALRWFADGGYDHLCLMNDDLHVLGNFVAAYARVHAELGIGLLSFLDPRGGADSGLVVRTGSHRLRLCSRMTGAMLSLTRPVLDTVGYFDPRIGRFGQEHCEFMHRARAAGFQDLRGAPQLQIDVAPEPPLLRGQDVPSSVSAAERDLGQRRAQAFLGRVRREEGLPRPFALLAEELPTTATRADGRTMPIRRPEAARVPRLELALLRAIVRGPIDEVAPLARSTAFDEGGFVCWLETQRLSACVFRLAQRRGVAAALPAALVERLRGSYLTQWRWNRRLLGRVAEIDAALRAAGLEVVVAKGLHLAVDLYGDIAGRHVGDIDLLTSDTGVLPEIEQVLVGLGYRRRTRELGPRAWTLRYLHHLEFDGPEAPLDLHWVFRRGPSIAVDATGVWHRRRRTLVDGVELSVLDAEDELLGLILGVHADVQVGILRLKSIVDVYALLLRLERGGAWEAFFTARAAERVERIAVNVLDFVLTVLDAAEDAPALARALERRRDAILLRDPAAKLALLERSRRGGRGRAWAFRLNDASLAHSVAWWAVSLPFRLAGHRPPAVSPGAAPFAPGARSSSPPGRPHRGNG